MSKSNLMLEKDLAKELRRLDLGPVLAVLVSSHQHRVTGLSELSQTEIKTADSISTAPVQIRTPPGSG